MITERRTSLSKIVFIAPNEGMAKLGYEILSVLSEEVEIKVGCMDYAVEVARSLNKQEVDVIIRGGTAS